MVRRHSWLVVGTGLSALVCVLIAGIAGYWQYANQWPSYPSPPFVMPVPNAWAMLTPSMLASVPTWEYSTVKVAASSKMSLGL